MPAAPSEQKVIKARTGYMLQRFTCRLGLSAQERLHLTDLFHHLLQLIPLLNGYLLAKLLSKGQDYLSERFACPLNSHCRGLNC